MTTIKNAGLLLSLMLILGAGNAIAANAVLNFQPLPNSTVLFGDFSTGDFGSPNASGSANDGTRFSYRLVTINGVDYYQMIVGEESTGFVYEYLQRFGGHVDGVSGADTRYLNGDSGGGEQAFAGVTTERANENDPFGLSAAGSHSSGDGTGVPTRSIFRLQVTDGPMVQDVLKDQFDKKPMITTSVVDGDFQSLFVTDMRDLSYNDFATAAPVVNTTAITDPTLPYAGAGDFDMSMVERSRVTAGQFSYTPGTGWNSNLQYLSAGGVFTPGTYTYIDGTGFDNLNTDWSFYFNYDDNATACNAPYERTPGSNDCPGGP